jgi:hypothetical protein
MTERLQQIVDEINAISVFNRDTYDGYKKTVIYIRTQLENLRHQHNNPILAIWTEMGIKELTNELNNRFNETFYQQDKERQKIEFTYSKTTVLLTLNNIIMNLK